MLNEPNVAIGFEQLAFGRGTLVIDDSPTTCWSNSSIELQRDAIVGSVVRTLPHSRSAPVAGFVASFYAVRQA